MYQLDPSSFSIHVDESYNFLFSSVTYMACKLPSNFSCLDAVFIVYHTCGSDATLKATPSVAVGVLITVVTVVMAAILFAFVKVTSKASIRHELYEWLEVIICLFSALLSFASLIINSIWMLGQVLASVCDLLTLSPQ